MENLESYLQHARDVLAKFEEFIGWDPPDVTKQKEKCATCPYNENHIMPSNRLDSHLKTCIFRKFGYTHEEIKQITEQERITEQMKDPNIVNTDDIIAKIAPEAGLLRNDKHYKCALDSDQRLAVYNATAAKCYSSENRMPDKALYADMEAKAAEKLYEKENPENLSEVAMMQKLRDMKRRRQSYRAKNVHITQRSQTEIIRNVLDVHMEELSRLWNPEKQPEAKEESSNPDEESKNHPFYKSRRESSYHDERTSRNPQEYRRRDSYRKEADSFTSRMHGSSSYERRKEPRESYQQNSSRDRRDHDEYKDVASSKKKKELRESYYSSRDRRDYDGEYKDGASTQRRESRESYHRHSSRDRRDDDGEYRDGRTSHKKRKGERSEKKHKKERHKPKRRKRSKSRV